MAQQIMHARNSDIEVLRAAAILFTLLEHLKVLFPWPVPVFDGLQERFMFTTGVDLFFVISGFVITRTLRPFRDAVYGAGSPIQEWLKFWVKRIFRLLPSAWLWLLAPMLLSTFLPEENTLFPTPSELVDEVVVGVLSIVNLRFYLCGEFPAMGSWCEHPQAMSHYWSLSLEEQFYLLLPLVFLLIPRRFLLLVVAALIASQFFHDRMIFTLGWYTRFDGLLWGVLLALCSERSWYSRLMPDVKGGVSRYLTPIVLLLLLAWLPKQLGGGGFDVHPVTMGLIALLPPGAIKSALMPVALWSYSLYLAHLPIFLFIRAWYSGSSYLTKEFNVIHAVALVVVALATSFILAALTYRCIEAPLREMGRDLARRRSE